MDQCVCGFASTPTGVDEHITYMVSIGADEQHEHSSGKHRC